MLHTKPFSASWFSRAPFFLVLTAVVPAALAQFTLTSETRSITASASGEIQLNDGSNTTGTYSNSIENDGMPDMTGDSESSQGIGAQDTDIETTGFSGNGSATSNVSLSGPIQDSFNGSAESQFDVTFTVSVPTGVKLTGQLTTTGGDGTASATFDTFSASASPSTPSVPISFSEMLEPGDSYTLELLADSDSAVSIDGQEFESTSDSGSGGYTFNFVTTSVPEPASLLAIPALFLLARRPRSKRDF